jgi:hypothetical protein
MKKLLLFFCLYVSLDTLAQDNQLIQKNYRNKISLSYPSSWIFREGGDFLAFIIFSPPENSEDRFRENINLIIDSSSRSMEIDLKSYVDSNMVFLEKNITEFKLDSVVRKEGNGVGSYDVFYSGSIPQSQLALRWMQRYMELDRIKYVFTYTYELNNTKTLSAAMEVFQTVKLLKD